MEQLIKVEKKMDVYLKKRFKAEKSKKKNSGAAFVIFESMFMRDECIRQMKKRKSKSSKIGKLKMQINKPGNPVDVNWPSFYTSFTYKKKTWRRRRYCCYTLFVILIRKQV